MSTIGSCKPCRQIQQRTHDELENQSSSLVYQTWFSGLILNSEHTRMPCSWLPWMLPLSFFCPLLGYWLTSLNSLLFLPVNFCCVDFCCHIIPTMPCLLFIDVCIILCYLILLFTSQIYLGKLVFKLVERNFYWFGKLLSSRKCQS